jgi:hypothetical protein
MKNNYFNQAGDLDILGFMKDVIDEIETMKKKIEELEKEEEKKPAGRPKKNGA